MAVIFRSKVTRKLNVFINTMSNKEIFEFIKIELSSVSIFEFLASNYSDVIISKLKERYHLNDTEELRNLIIKNGPDLYGFAAYKRAEKEKRLQALKENLRTTYRKEGIQEEIDLIKSELKIWPTNYLIIKNEKIGKQTELICRVLFKELISYPYDEIYKTVKQKKNGYSFSKCYLNTNQLEDIKFNNNKNGDIENWREELLDLFKGKLPQITTEYEGDFIEPALLSIKNGLLYGQTIITNDDTICLNLSDGIMVKINFYKKNLVDSESKIYYDCPTPRRSTELYSTDGYVTSITLPNNVIFVTKNNVANFHFETSPLLIGFAQLGSSSIVPVIEKIREYEF